MKYSIIVPYFSRPELRFMLSSFVTLYGKREDLEIIIVEDSKNFRNKSLHDELLRVVDSFKGYLSIVVVLDEYPSYNPSKKFNLGVSISKGSVIILTNPETPHTLDILSKLDDVDFTDKYIVCDCCNMKLIKDKGDFFSSTFQFLSWYQHGENDRNLHFCSAISRQNFDKIGGFDERYAIGFFVEDRDFLRRVKNSGLKIVPRSDLVTYHIDHPRHYSMSNEEKIRLIAINNQIFNDKVKNNEF